MHAGRGRENSNVQVLAPAISCGLSVVMLSALCPGSPEFPVRSALHTIVPGTTSYASRTAPECIPEMGADQFADDITIRGDFENAPLLPSQISVLPPGSRYGHTAHMWREEGCQHVVPRAIAATRPRWWPGLFPRPGCDAGRANERRCKKSGIAIRQKLRVMLAAHVAILVPPDHLVGGLINDKQQTTGFLSSPGISPVTRLGSTVLVWP